MLSSIGSTAVLARSQAVDQFFKKVDSNGDGKITKGELTQALDSAGGKSQVDQVFKLLDTGNKGYITKQDTAAGLAKLDSPPSGAATAKGSGAARGGGGGGGASAAAVATLDPADTNQDGKVSLQEELAYMLKQYLTGDSNQQPQSATYA